MSIRPAHSAAANRKTALAVAIVEPCAAYCGGLRPTDSSKLHYLPPRQTLGYLQWLCFDVSLWLDRVIIAELLEIRLSPGHSLVPACGCSLWAEHGCCWPIGGLLSHFNDISQIIWSTKFTLFRQSRAKVFSLNMQDFRFIYSRCN